MTFFTIMNFSFSQVLGEDEFVKCLHSVGVRIIFENFSILSKIGGKQHIFKKFRDRPAVVSQ